jgi:hypothetical protein
MDERDRQIKAGLLAGRTQKAISEAIGISGPAVSARITRNPELWRLRRQPKGKQSLSEHRQHLHRLELDAKNLARRLRRAVQIVDEELIELEVQEALD